MAKLPQLEIVKCSGEPTACSRICLFKMIVDSFFEFNHRWKVQSPAILFQSRSITSNIWNSINLKQLFKSKGFTELNWFWNPLLIKASQLKRLLKLKRINSDRDTNLIVLWYSIVRYPHFQNKLWIIDGRQVYSQPKQFYINLHWCLNKRSSLNRVTGGHEFCKHHTVLIELLFLQKLMDISSDASLMQHGIMTSALLRSVCMLESWLIVLMCLVKQHSSTYTLSETHDSGNYIPWDSRNMEQQVLRFLKSSLKLVECCYMFVLALHKNDFFSAMISSVNRKDLQWNWITSLKFGESRWRS